MARIKACGVCWKPVAECICDEEPAAAPASDGDRDEGDAA